MNLYLFIWIAETEGFKPSVVLPTVVFKTTAINQTLPRFVLYRDSAPRSQHYMFRAYCFTNDKLNPIKLRLKVLPLFLRCQKPFLSLILILVLVVFA